MSARDPHLEKTTQTDLLYAMALEQQSDIAVLDPETPDSAPHAEQHGSDAIHQQAATRADSSLTAQIRFDGANGGSQGTRWRSLDGFIPPQRTKAAQPGLPVVIDHPTPQTLRQRLRAAGREAYGCLLSLAVHLVILPLLMLMAFPQPPIRSGAMLEGSHASNDQFEYFDVPQIMALPSDFEMHVSTPVTLELAVPEPRFEKGALPRLIAEAPRVAANVKAVRGPIDDIGGVIDAEGRGKARLGKSAGGAEFFGTKASGHKFVFVVDCSLSMLENDRWLKAASELIAAVDRLEPDQLFYVILFDGGVHRMFNHQERDAALYPATADNKQRLREWLASVRLGYETRPFLAMRSALALGPDAIYLLSDGDFRDPTADFLKKYNRPFDHAGHPLHQAVVHTFCFQSHDGKAVMRRIANENAGQYRFIPTK